MYIHTTYVFLSKPTYTDSKPWLCPNLLKYIVKKK